MVRKTLAETEWWSGQRYDRTHTRSSGLATAHSAGHLRYGTCIYSKSLSH